MPFPTKLVPPGGAVRLCGWGTTRRWWWFGVRGPLGDGWSLCGAAAVAAVRRGALVSAFARVVGVCLVIACRNAFVVVITRTFQAL